MNHYVSFMHTPYGLKSCIENKNLWITLIQYNHCIESSRWRRKTDTLLRFSAVIWVQMWKWWGCPMLLGHQNNNYIVQRHGKEGEVGREMRKSTAKLNKIFVERYYFSAYGFMKAKCVLRRTLLCFFVVVSFVSPLWLHISPPLFS